MVISGELSRLWIKYYLLTTMSLNKIQSRWLLFFHQDLGVAIRPAKIAWAESQAVKTDSPLAGLAAYRRN